MMQLSDITFEYLTECFELDAILGTLTWKTRPATHFASGAAGALRWNKIYAGKLAGCLDKDAKFERTRVSIGDRDLRCHRIVFAMFNGIDLVDVPNIIDHINGNQLDDRPVNLREATPAQNRWNSKTPSTSSSGIKGVAWDGSSWSASIRQGGKKIMIGRFEEKELAAAAYREAALRLRGEFARF